ncbi:AI-2E family transporter [candidate division GN15 bacterium]|nr:AI-2E family transporter [candidate division GN15 bacterium]
MTYDELRETRALSGFSTIGRGLIYGGALVLIVAGLRAASSIVVPLLLALFLSIICAPLLNVLQRKLPFPLALGLLLTMLIAIFLAVPILIGGSLQQMINTLPDQQEQLQGLEATVANQMQQWGWGTSADDLLGVIDPASLTPLLSQFLTGLLRTFSDGAMVFFLIAFMLTEASQFAFKLSLVDRGSGEAAKKVLQIVTNVRRYVNLKTVVSIATGLCIWLGLLALGIEYAIVWGFIAFLLNYIPNIGSIIAGIPPVLFALAEHGLGTALGVSVLYVIVNQVFGSLIEPRLQGQGLGLSPLIVFCSLIFWGWIFGTIGMLLSAPLTMAVRIVLEQFPETRGLATMLGDKPEELARRPASLTGSENHGC